MELLLTLEAQPASMSAIRLRASRGSPLPRYHHRFPQVRCEGWVGTRALGGASNEGIGETQQLAANFSVGESGDGLFCASGPLLRQGVRGIDHRVVLEASDHLSQRIVPSKVTLDGC